MLKKIYFLLAAVMIMSSCTKQEALEVEVFETSASGNKLTKISEFSASEDNSTINLNPEKTFQSITGFLNLCPNDSLGFR